MKQVIETAEDKAKELVKKAYVLVNVWGTAKQCALITVDEVIKEMKDSDPCNWSIPFWKEIKKEIKKL